MSHYSCPECSGSTTVTETRRSSNRIRRRRLCSNGHRFTTMEIPHQAGKDLIDLIRWMAHQQTVTDDIADYAVLQVNSIITGIELPPED